MEHIKIMKSIVVHISGGLGNQMFQYAMGHALALRLGVPLKLDLAWFEHTLGSTATSRKFLLDIFPIQIIRACEEERRCQFSTVKFFYQKIFHSLFPKSGRVIEPHFHYWYGIKKLRPPLYLQGFWQSEEYFSDYSGVIKECYRFPSISENVTYLAVQKICSCMNATSVHIRRGDYVADPSTNAYHGQCSATYYKKSIEFIRNKHGLVPLFIFSDDPEWVEKSFDAHGHPSTIINLHSEETAYRDMHLMSLCRNHVIANSSFSWWGAWLSNYNGTVCAPCEWFSGETGSLKNPCPSRWQLF